MNVSMTSNKPFSMSTILRICYVDSNDVGATHVVAKKFGSGTPTRKHFKSETPTKNDVVANWLLLRNILSCMAPALVQTSLHRNHYDARVFERTFHSQFSRNKVRRNNVIRIYISNPNLAGSCEYTFLLSTYSV